MFDRLEPHQFDEYRVLEFNDCAARPDVVLVDSSFIRSALRRCERQDAEVVTFLDHLDLVGTEILYSAYTEFEVLQAAHGMGAEAARRHVAALRELLRSTQLHWVGIDAVSDEVPHLMEQFGLTVSGAVHVATASDWEVDGFVTVDPAFGVVDKERLPLIIDAGGAKQARRLRARSGRDVT
ncbi:hypothetical protein [Curtobacterium sp. BRB10]|uniref:type II toxin-antitoxin system VapC family toxin n=1 Tax=Curtobacterium sp. BRB10 TaxID=2962579 RepID=UPI002881F74F|nr:hypothetical protein [Curtobacterium sp. BRB10]MDT0231966.1 hypothetical protein [Curtobacterium sp. BRB10]